MKSEFPGAVPEIPVKDVDKAAAYYKSKLGFSVDWVAKEVASRESRKVAADCS